MIPILFAENATDFSTQGIGPLTECSSCETDYSGGFPELTLQYPRTGEYFHRIRRRAIIYAKANHWQKPQPFRIYKIGKVIKGTVTVRARHLAYDTAGVPVAPFEALTARAAAAKLESETVIAHPFKIYTDVVQTAVLKTTIPKSLRELLFGSGDSLQGVYGGEIEFDHYQIRLLTAAGKDRGEVIRYGVDMTDFSQEENISKVFTGVLPYYHGRGSDGAVVIGDVVQCAGSYSFMRILPADVTDYFEDVPTKAAVTAAGTQYIADNGVGVPEVSQRVGVAPGKDVRMYDTVGVEFVDIGVETKAKICGYHFDSLREKIRSVDVGSVRKNITDSIAQHSRQVKTIPTTTQMQQAILDQTKTITGVKGGYVVYHHNSDGQPYEILIMDEPTEAAARKVLRINNLGIGFSTVGVNGPFETAWTIDGTFNAKWISAGFLSVDRIQAKSIVTDKLEDQGVTTGKIKDLAVSTAKIGGSAVTYGKTGFQGTLDQVGVNKTDIATLFGYYNNLGNMYINGTNAAATIQNLGVTTSFYFRGRYVQWKTIKDGDGYNQVVLAVIPEN